MSRTKRINRYPRDEWNSFDAFFDDEWADNQITTMARAVYGHEEDYCHTYKGTMERCKKLWAECTRDGYYEETSRRSGFKQDAKKHVRIANRRFCGKVLRDEEHDNIGFPMGNEGKLYKWDWW